MLFELLTGSTALERHRLQDNSLAELLRAIRDVDPPRPSTCVTNGPKLAEIAQQRASEPAQLARQIRGELDWIVLRALEKDRQRRYESAAAFALDIRNFLENKPVAACPPSRGYLFKKWVQRNKVPFIAGNVVAAAILTGLCVSTVLYFQERAARESATKSEARANSQRILADAARIRASDEAANANAVNSFLRFDLLNQASPWSQSKGTLGDPGKITLRSVLDRAAMRHRRPLSRPPARRSRHPPDDRLHLRGAQRIRAGEKTS